MTETQFLVLIGTIYIAPHMNKLSARTIGLIAIIFAAIEGLKGGAV